MPSPYGNSPPRAIKVAAVVPMYLPFAELRDNACRYENHQRHRGTRLQILRSAGSSAPPVLRGALRRRLHAGGAADEAEGRINHADRGITDGI